MKKLIPILIILSVFTGCIVGSALADDFSIRNGIRFGLSIDEVEEIEHNNGLKAKEVPLMIDVEKQYFESIGIDTNDLINQESPSLTDEQKKILYNMGRGDLANNIRYLIYDNVNIAGCKDCSINYTFRDNSLTTIEYEWIKKWWPKSSESTMTESSFDSEFNIHKTIFDTLNSNLEKKYEMIGKLINKNSASVVLFQDEWDWYEPFDGVEYSKLGDTYDTYGYNQYLSRNDDTNVEIVIRCYMRSAKDYSNPFSSRPGYVEIRTVVKYRTLTDEDIAQSEERAKDSENDL